MATEVVESNGEAGVTTLISGIVQDARELIVEQMKLFKVEIKNDVRRFTTAMGPLLGGVGVILTGLILLGISCAHLLLWAVPDMPVWGAYGIVGVIFALGGGLLVWWAKSILDEINPTTDTAMQGLKENLQWKTKK